VRSIPVFTQPRPVAADADVPGSTDPRASGKPVARPLRSKRGYRDFAERQCDVYVVAMQNNEGLGPMQIAARSGYNCYDVVCVTAQIGLRASIGKA
jgi:hypothetical protein